MKHKRVIFPIFVLLCMAVIFFFSSQNAKTSQGLSDEVAIKALEIKSEIINKEATEQEKENYIVNTRTLIRKGAHFTIYLLLGIFVFMTLKSYQIKHAFLYSILFCFFYACTDEFHQLFINERTARIFDILIDTSGASVGVLFLDILYKKKCKRKISSV